MSTLLKVQEDGKVDRFCKLCVRILCVSRDPDCSGVRNTTYLPT